MRRFNQRTGSTEEKKNMRKAVLFIVLTVAAISLIFFVGIPVLGKFTAFVSGLRGGNKQIDKTDTTPPAPPKFNYFSEFTNQQNITITGNTEAGVTVKLTFDGEPQEVLADNAGSFSFNLTLQNGTSTLNAVAVDQAGNISQTSKDYQITFDNKPPELLDMAPTDGTSYFGSNQRQITVQGKTETDSQVTINDRVISVDDAGLFQYTTTLNEGANTFNIKSTDLAGNLTEKNITLNFTP
jgi:hypothetical protein